MALHLSRWGESGPRPAPNPALNDLFGGLALSASVHIDADCWRVWEVVSTVERVGEFSPECVRAWWVDGFPARAAGGRFEGLNRAVVGPDTVEWIRPCDVVVHDPPVEFSWTVGDKFDGTPATRWTYIIGPEGSGSRLRQQFAHLPEGLSGLRLQAESDPKHAAALVMARRADLEAGMRQTLDRIRQHLDPS